MNFKNYLKESPIEDNSNQRLGDRPLNSTLFDTRLIAPALYSKKVGDINMKVVELESNFTGQKQCSAIAYKPNQRIGKVDCIITPKLPYPQVEIAIVPKEYQGKGIGIELYYALIEYYGGLISDKELTKGTIAIWIKLSKMYPYSYIIDKNSMYVKRINQISRVNIGKVSELFMVSKTPFNKDYLL